MKKGFTLLELLIVVIIIGILATLAIPNFFRAAERAKWAEAKTTLGTLRSAQIRYRAQYNVYLDDAVWPFEALDVEFTAPQHFTFVVANNSSNLAMATRTAGDYTGQTISTDVDGAFAYSGGVPVWLQ